MSNGLVYIPVSVGELYDKISILEIKRDRVQDPVGRENVTRELELLRGVEAELGLASLPQLQELVDRLRHVNLRIWHSENVVRTLAQDEGSTTDYLMAARSSYSNNDERAKLKRKINDLTNSQIVEEKHHSTVREV